jgi:hypothetical protein
MSNFESLMPDVNITSPTTDLDDNTAFDFQDIARDNFNDLSFSGEIATKWNTLEPDNITSSFGNVFSNAINILRENEYRIPSDYESYDSRQMVEIFRHAENNSEFMEDLVKAGRVLDARDRLYELPNSNDGNTLNYAMESTRNLLVSLDDFWSDFLDEYSEEDINSYPADYIISEENSLYESLENSMEFMADINQQD